MLVFIFGIIKDSLLYWERCLGKRTQKDSLSAAAISQEHKQQGEPSMATYTSPSQCHVALLCGGISGEREVSLNSGKGAQEALIEAGFQVTMLDPALKQDLHTLVNGEFDVVFIALHGEGGEDGSIQGMLETLGLPYTGSGVAASAFAINKTKAKMIYREAGIPTPASLSYTRFADVDTQEIFKKIGNNCVVKACSEGSSNGIYIVNDKDAITQAIQEAFTLSQEVLVERYIPGDEFTVAVLGNSDIEALPVIQIVPASEYYDYEAKYAPGGSQHLCPAPIKSSLSEKMQEMAIRAHKALGCAGVSRSDFIVDNNDDIWILETNTIPGMTATSLLPDAARAKGYSFAQVTRRLIDLAFEKYRVTVND